MHKHVWIGLIAISGCLLIGALYERSSCSASLNFISDAVSPHGHNRRVAIYRFTNTGSVPVTYFSEGSCPIYFGKEFVDGDWKKTDGISGVDETVLAKLPSGQSIDFEVLPFNVCRAGIKWKVAIGFYANDFPRTSNPSFLQAVAILLQRRWNARTIWSEEHPNHLSLTAVQ
jgi:hypothetical protein